MKKITLLIIGIILSYNSYSLVESNKENELGENLKVDVRMTLPKEIIKYVVYASSDEGKTMEDTLVLPDFVMTQDTTKAGFQGATAPKVYTKRVVGGKVENLSSTEKVTYELTHPDGFMPKVLNDTIKESSTSYRNITGYLPKSTLTQIVNMLGKDYVVSETGSIRKGSSDAVTTPAYVPGAQINMHNNKGILETTTPSYTHAFQIPAEDISKIETFIGSGLPLAKVSLKVSIN
ncbi:hypothetical protein [Cetobacterium sp.]|uniref:hypothetical protein n=1 Tax=Cetobacterium sp. TaxID=2071632 RepID=UPI003F3192D4